MSSEVNRMDGNERFRQLVKSDNVKIIAKLLSELGLTESKKLIEECYRDEPESAVIQYVRRAANSSLTKHDEILDCCKLLLKYGADVNQMNQSKKTALHLACRLGDDKMVKLLIDHGADPSIIDGSCFNSLHIAVHTCAIECVRLIIAKTKDLLNMHDSHGSAPVLTAVQKCDADLVHLLVTSGADVNIQELTSKRTPLHYALYLQNKELFQYLLNNGADLTRTDHRETNIVHRCCAVSEPWYLEQILSSNLPDVKKALKMEDGDGATPVIVTCQNGNIDQLRRLVESGAPVASKDRYRRCALHHCAENTDTRCAEYILRSIPSLMTSTDEEGLTPLHMAVIAGNVPLIKLLLKRGANLKSVDNEKHTVLHWATVCSHPDVLDVLLENGADVNIPDKHRAYPVHYAAQMVNSNGASQLILKTLLHNKASVESEDKDKRTPIIWAASAGSSNGCAILVDSGADVNRADKDDLTALHCAASRGHTQCVEMLVKYCKSNLDPVDKNQCTPLFYAATLGHLDCLKILLDLGADSNHTDTRGRTVAHCAVVSGSTEALQILSEYNIDLWSRNIKSDQPIHEAAQSGHIDILVYLLEHSDDQHDVVDSPNGDGRTCLHIAALTNNLWLCKTLLDNHANVNAIMSNKGKYFTPLDVAAIKSHYDIRDLLTSHGGRPGHSIVDHAVETIQVKYKYFKKHSLRTQEPSDSQHQLAHNISENHKSDVDAGGLDGPKYVDKSTQIRSKPVNKNLRKPTVANSAADDQGHTQTSDTPKDSGQKSGDTEGLQKPVSKDLPHVIETSSISQLSSSGHKRILSKQERIRQPSQSLECETPSEKSTSHGNTSDIEPSSGDPVQTKAKVKRTLKSRKVKTTGHSDSSVQQTSVPAETEGETSHSFSFPSLSEDSLGHYKGDYSASDKGHKSKLSNFETSQETEEFDRTDTERMGCGSSRVHAERYAPNNELSQGGHRECQEMNEIQTTQCNSQTLDGRLKYRARIVVRNRNSSQQPRNHIKVIIKKNRSRRANGPSPGHSPGRLSSRPSVSSSVPPSDPPSVPPSGPTSVPPSGPHSVSPSVPPSGPPSVLPSGPYSVPPSGPHSVPQISPPSSPSSGRPSIHRPDPERLTSSRSVIQQDDQVKDPISGSLSRGESVDSPHSSESHRHSPRKPTSTNSRIQTVRVTVKRFEAERRSIRQLQQIKRMMIYSSPVRNSTTFQNLLYLYNQRHYSDISDTLRRCQEQMRPRQTHRNNHNGQTEMNYDENKVKYGKENKDVRQRDADKAGHFSDRHSKSLEDTKRHDDNANNIERRPQTSQVTRRSRPTPDTNGYYNDRRPTPDTNGYYNDRRPTPDTNGYYNDPRLSSSPKAIRERHKKSNLLLKEAYKPFGGVDIFTSTSSFQSESHRRGRPNSNVSASSNSSSGSKTRQSRDTGSKKTKAGERTRKKEKPDSIEE